MQSEVADLLAQISAEYEAAQRGLYAPSLGTSQHAFITEKMERMGAIHSELCGLVGEQKAIALIAAELEECSDSMLCTSHGHRFSFIVAASICKSSRGSGGNHVTDKSHDTDQYRLWIWPTDGLSIS